MRWTTAALMVSMSCVACARTDPAPTADPIPGPTPGEMCPAGSDPIAAAYDRATGGYLWSACEPGGGMFIAEAAGDDRVWVRDLDAGPIAFDIRSGEELGRGVDADFPRQPGDDIDTHQSDPPMIDGVQLSGGQDDPLRGTDRSTGTTWQRVGYTAYDNVWAAGDGAVFVTAPSEADPDGRWVVTAYDVADGAVRWQDAPLGSYAYPWHVEGRQLFVLWWNLEVRSTTDGSVVWATAYPEPVSGYPRMFGVVANDDTVVVSFTSIASDGD